MDWQQRTELFVSSWLPSRQHRVLAIAALTAACLVALQFSHLSSRPPAMCELISQCPLGNGDVQRMQLALSEAGLSDFRVERQQILVPSQEHATYLNAVSERDALPLSLRKHTDSQADTNPFLSRSQQQSIQAHRKKRQIREMILRLPFVQQAWLEMDNTKSTSPFQNSHQTAVVSIEPTAKGWLSEQQVDTIRRTVGGAVASLPLDHIEVIDVAQGVAYPRARSAALAGGDPVQQRFQLRQQQQTQLQQQIESALQRFDGVTVQVQLSDAPLAVADEQQAPQPRVEEPKAAVKAQLIAGSNGSVSIYNSTVAVSKPSVPVQPAGYQNPKRESKSRHACRVAVAVSLPEAALDDVAMPLMLRPSFHSSSESTADPVEQKFSAVRPQIEREITSLLPAEWLANSGNAPVQISLERAEPAVAANDWKRQLSDFAGQHWPSAATLIVGLVLLTLVTGRSSDPAVDIEPAAVVLPIKSHVASDGELDQTKQKINQLIQDDPRAAARAIEGWIGKAG